MRLTTRLLHLRQVDADRLAKIEQPVADVYGCDEEIARLRRENERVARELAVEHEESAPAPESATHLVFVQLAGRYELLERAGPPPPRHSRLALADPERALVVAGARRSPLPGDPRPCVVAEAPAASGRLPADQIVLNCSNGCRQLSQ